MQQLRARAAPGLPPYTVTEDDRLWLLRAVAAEGPDERQVAGVLVNGFIWNRSRGGRGTLASWVRAYAQPVNPRWYEGGDLFLRRTAKTTSEGAMAELARARAREFSHSTRTTFDSATRKAVRAALAGMPDGLDPRAVDYAAPHVASNRIPLEPVPTTHRNRLYTRTGAETWQGYTGSAQGSGRLIALLSAGLAAGAAFLAARGKKRRA